MEETSPENNVDETAYEVLHEKPGVHVQDKLGINPRNQYLRFGYCKSKPQPQFFLRYYHNRTAPKEMWYLRAGDNPCVCSDLPSVLENDSNVYSSIQQIC